MQNIKPYHYFRNEVSTSFNSATIATGALIIGGLMILSVLLYMFDTWATKRYQHVRYIDMLLILIAFTWLLFVELTACFWITMAQRCTAN